MYLGLSTHYRSGCSDPPFGNFVILTEKITLHAALFFMSKQRILRRKPEET